MKSALFHILLACLPFLQACYCLSGPNVQWDCQTINKSIVLLDQKIRPVSYNAFFEFTQVDDTLYLNYFDQWSKQEYFELFFVKPESGLIEFDSIRSYFTVIDGFDSHNYSFENFEWNEEEYSPNECCSDARVNCSAMNSIVPKSFKGTLKAQIFTISGVLFLEIRLALSSQLAKYEEC